MVSAGWLPPETRGDHFKVTAAQGVLQGQSAKQAKFMETLMRARLESPDFAQVQGNLPKTTSLMSGGFDVRDVHMVTAWEALVEMTTGLVNEEFWKIT
jgi:hypothetical protein